MKAAKLILAGFLFLNFLSCNSSANKEDDHVVPQDSAQAETETAAVSYTPEEKEAIVNKGGPKADEQLILEDLLLELESNLEKTKGGQFETMLGHWVGAFGKNKINITLTSINETDKTVNGYSVCAGNFRSLKGSYNLTGNVYSFILNEPGDDPYDGKFEF